MLLAAIPAGLTLCVLGVLFGVQVYTDFADSLELRLLESEIRLGPHHPGDNVSIELIVLNSSSKDCELIGLEGVCTCEVAIDFPVVVPSRGQAIVPVKFSVPADYGQFHKEVKVLSTYVSPEGQRLMAHIQGAVVEEPTPTIANKRVR